MNPNDSIYVTLMTWVDSNNKRWLRVFDSDVSAANYKPALEYERTFMTLSVNDSISYPLGGKGINFEDFLPGIRVIY